MSHSNLSQQNFVSIGAAAAVVLDRLLSGEMTASEPQSHLHITCDGRTVYDEDVAIYGTYEIDSAVDLGVCDRLDEVMDHVEGRLARDDISAGDEDAVGFIPKVFRIHDEEQRLVLAGEPWRRGVRWCEPIGSDREADDVQAEMRRLNTEASIEAGWDNYETARQLRHQANVLAGRLVDPCWRDAARLTLARRSGALAA